MTEMTPGQAAFEAWEAALIDPPAARMKWDRLTGDEEAETYRAAWEAAAQAAITASDERKQVIELREEIDSLRELLNEAGVAEPLP